MEKKIVISEHDETSLKFDGDFEKNQFSKNIKDSLLKSLALRTKLTDEIKFMSGMSGRKYRYFINNLVQVVENPRYLEIGTWAGSTLCSALYLNRASATCIDNWLKFKEEEAVKKIYHTKDQKKEFEQNLQNLKNSSKDIDVKFIEADFRKINYSTIGKFNIYCYDALHDEKSHYDGIKLISDALDETFILIIDDWNWKQVRKGTLDGLKDSKISVISSIEIKTNQQDSMPKIFLGQFSEWHNGYFIAVCKKAK